VPLKLPEGFPQVIEDKLLFTRQHTEGPTEVVEGYFRGSLEEAHKDFEEEVDHAGFVVLSNELEEDDSEVSWSGKGRSGRVALRRECPTPDKIYVRITNRPA
jgi:hypothetical protein